MRFIAVLLLMSFLVAGAAPLVFAETKEERRVRLESQLEEIERQILKQQVLVEDKQLERQSLERDVAILDGQIEKARLGIQARTVAIQQLDTQITDKQLVINELNERLERQRQSLGQLIRKTSEVDDYSLVEILMGNKNLSEFFEDLESFQSIKSELNDSVDDLTEIKEVTFEQKISLEDKQSSELELRKLQELEKQEIEVKEEEKTEILEVTKGEEAAYQALLREQQKTASQIRQQLFELRDSGAIPFPEAVRLAEFAGSQTGVRPALIMGILTQETRLGENLGVVGRWSTDMHPTRDQPIFKAMSEVLGFDPDLTPVSAKPSYGWGGAMGPSQFIPSTWAIYGGFVKNGSGEWVYNQSEDVIRRLIGKSGPSNPYENQDAFMATALLMRDNGAAAGTLQAERLAALRYFAGWGNATNPAYAFYGDGVMQHTARIQQEIEILQGG